MIITITVFIQEAHFTEKWYSDSFYMYSFQYKTAVSHGTPITAVEHYIITCNALTYHELMAWNRKPEMFTNLSAQNFKRSTINLNPNLNCTLRCRFRIFVLLVTIMDRIFGTHFGLYTSLVSQSFLQLVSALFSAPFS